MSVGVRRFRNIVHLTPVYRQNQHALDASQYEEAGCIKYFTIPQSVTRVDVYATI